MNLFPLRPAAAFLCCVLFGVCSLQAVQLGDIEFHGGDPMLPVTPEGGYYWVEARLINHGSEQVGIELRLELAGDESASARRRLVLPAGGENSTAIGFPVPRRVSDGYAGYYGRVTPKTTLSVYADGRRIGAFDGVMRPMFYPVATSDEWRRWQTVNNVAITTRGDAEITKPVSEWSTDPRGYEGLGLLFVSLREYRQMPPGVRRAVERWIQLGGRMAVMLRPEDPWPEEFPGAASGFHRETRGLGELALSRPATAQELESILARVAEIEKEESDAAAAPAGPGGYGGMGGNYRPAIADYAGIGAVQDQYNRRYQTGMHPDLLTPAAERLQEWTIRSRTTLPTPNAGVDPSRMALPAGDVPLLLLFLVMLAFVAVIGPVNYLFLKKRDREALFLLTAPVISLAFCLVVILFVTFREGWHARGRAVAVTLLDQETQQAATVANYGWYAPLGVRRLTFDMDTMLELMPETEPSAVIAGDQEFGGLVRPRIATGIRAKRLERRVERMRPAAETPDQMTLVNGLGRDVRRVLAVGRDGVVFGCETPVAAGGDAVLKPTGRSSGAREFAPVLLYETLRNYSLAAPPDLTATAFNLPPGYYVALVEEALFFEPGYECGDWLAANIVIGRFNREDLSEDAD